VQVEVEDIVAVVVADLEETVTTANAKKFVMIAKTITKTSIETTTEITDVRETNWNPSTRLMQLVLINLIGKFVTQLQMIEMVKEVTIMMTEETVNETITVPEAATTITNEKNIVANVVNVNTAAAAAVVAEAVIDTVGPAVDSRALLLKS